jgi:hypothetical protein
MMMLAQKQKIAGTVMDTENQKLSAVNIVLYNSKNELIKELKTDGSGGFILEGINEQNVKLVVRNNGYSVFEKNLDLENLMPYKLFSEKKPGK